MTSLLRDELGDAFSLRPFKPGQTSQDDNSLIVTLGPEALTLVRQESRNVPILALLVDKPFINGYTNQAEEQHLGAIFYAPPLIRQAVAGKVILPHATRVSMLATPDSTVLYEQLKEQLPAFGLEGQVFVVSSNDNLIPTLIRALEYGDFLLAAPDNTIYNPRTIKHILLTTYRRNRIVIGPSQAYVKAGALASTYAPLRNVATQAAEVINDYQVSKRFPPPFYPDEFRLEINEQVARSLNIPLPSRQELVDGIKARLSSSLEGDND
ncbi:MAG: ABC transporter substrate-binding protein [Marinobacter sp.]